MIGMRSAADYLIYQLPVVKTFNYHAYASFSWGISDQILGDKKRLRAQNNGFKGDSTVFIL